MKAYQVEICLDQSDHARSAQSFGADRVELCARLDLDGITPSRELITATRAAAPDLGLFVMIRPAGGFCYDTPAVEQMLAEIEMAKSLGADGIVGGALLADGTLDLATTQMMVEAAGELPFTFHRAFDVCASPLSAALALGEIGVARILSSGQAPTAVEGLSLLEQLAEMAQAPAFMAGSGVSAENIPALWTAGLRQFHFTCHRKVGPPGFDEAKAEAAFSTLEELH